MTAVMKVINPTPITDSLFTSSNVTEADYSVWNSGTVYSIGDHVILTTSVHKIYIAIQAGTNHDPETETDYWVEVGPTNRWAMFDTNGSTLTVNATSIVTVLEPGQVTGLAAFDLRGRTFRAVLKDEPGGTIKYDTGTVSLDGSEVTGEYELFYGEYIQKTEVIVTDMPPYVNCELTVTIATTGGNAECGSLVVGRVRDLGNVLAPVTAGIIDYSRKDTDEFGTTTFVPRAFSKRVSLDMKVDLNQLTRVQRWIAALRATPAVWVVSENPTYSSLAVLGWFRDFSITVQYQTHFLCSLELEGLSQS